MSDIEGNIAEATHNNIIYTYFTEEDGISRGKGTVYNDNGVKCYEGEIVDGKPNGEGISYYENGVKCYKGQYKDDKFYDKGIVYYENGIKFYEGDFVDNKFHGKGTFYDKNGVKRYEGKFVDSNKHGKGIGYDKNGVKFYEGDYVDHEPNGEGKFYILWKNKEICVYDGKVLNGLRHGKGTSYTRRGKIDQSGQWEYNKFVLKTPKKRVRDEEDPEKVDSDYKKQKALEEKGEEMIEKRLEEEKAKKKQKMKDSKFDFFNSPEKSVKAKYKQMLKDDNKVKEKMKKWREDVVKRGRSDLLENQPKKGKK